MGTVAAGKEVAAKAKGAVARVVTVAKTVEMVVVATAEAEATQVEGVVAAEATGCAIRWR